MAATKVAHIWENHLSGFRVNQDLARRSNFTKAENEDSRKLEIVMHPIAMGALFALQCFHVLFLALHDWIPLGTLNDVKAVRAANPGRKLVAATLISLTPFAIGLAASTVYFGRAYPAWLFKAKLRAALSALGRAFPFRDYVTFVAFRAVITAE
jgi:hypothetical protein